MTNSSYFPLYVLYILFDKKLSYDYYFSDDNAHFILNYDKQIFKQMINLL